MLFFIKADYLFNGLISQTYSLFQGFRYKKFILLTKSKDETNNLESFIKL